VARLGYGERNCSTVGSWWNEDAITRYCIGSVVAKTWRTRDLQVGVLAVLVMASVGSYN
jgi:hypothetical protein